VEGKRIPLLAALLFSFCFDSHVPPILYMCSLSGVEEPAEREEVREGGEEGEREAGGGVGVEREKEREREKNGEMICMY